MSFVDVKIPFLQGVNKVGYVNTNVNVIRKLCIAISRFRSIISDKWTQIHMRETSLYSAVNIIRNQFFLIYFIMARGLALEAYNREDGL